MSSSSRRLYGVLGAGALLGLSAQAPAANWEFLPRIEAGGTYNDNYRMVPASSGEVQAYGPFIDAQLNLSLVSPRGKFEIVPRLYSIYFPSDSSDNSTDEYLDMDGEYKGLRSDLTGLAQYANETVIYSELLPAAFPGVALGQTVAGTYGRVGVRERLQMEHLAPEYLYDITPRTHLDLSADYQHDSFGQSVIQHVGFANYTGRVGMRFDVTPQSTISLTGVESQFQPQLGGHDTNRYGADLEWSGTPSQVMHTYLRLGANRVQADTALGTADSNGITGGAGVEWQYQITEVILDAVRSLSPSSAGAEVVSDELRFRVLHAFEPRLSGIFAARAARLRGASNQPELTIDGEDYLAGEVGAEYQLTMSFRVVATYDYTWQRFQGESAAASNAVNLAVVYQPLSRFEPLPEYTGIPQDIPQDIPQEP
ncbi:MAG: hypothetical protein ACREV7_16965 [Steroidobacteraceae bacterium]